MRTLWGFLLTIVLLSTAAHADVADRRRLLLAETVRKLPVIDAKQYPNLKRLKDLQALEKPGDAKKYAGLYSKIDFIAAEKEAEALSKAGPV